MFTCSTNRDSSYNGSKKTTDKNRERMGLKMRQRKRIRYPDYHPENDSWGRPHKALLLWVSRLFIVITIFIFGMIGCRQDDRREQKQYERFIVATLPWPGSTPFYVGIDQGLFKDEGLDVTLKTVPTGKIGLEAVLAGQADVAGAADTPIARAAVNGDRIAVIATIAEIQRAIMIIAKNDGGIAGPGDLKGKAIGVTKGAGAEFFLHIYLLDNDIVPSEVNIVNIAPDKIVESLINGEVEAVSTWSPYKLVLLEKLGTNAIVLTDPALYQQTFNIVTAQDFARKNGESLERFLRGVQRANNFIRTRPNEALAIMSKYIGIDSTIYRKEWSDYSFTTLLHQGLLLNLEDQARWMIEQDDATTSRSTPNILGFIDANPLKRVEPQAVGIIGK